jgi:hypothetical protein
MIIIFHSTIITEPLTGEVSRAAFIYITDGQTSYVLDVAQLPAEGDLQAILDAQEAQLWLDAVSVGNIATPSQNAQAEFLLYLINNPNAKQIFDLSAGGLVTEINAFVDRIIPSATNADRTRLKRLLAVGALRDRVDVAGN